MMKNAKVSSVLMFNMFLALANTDDGTEEDNPGATAGLIIVGVAAFFLIAGLLHLFLQHNDWEVCENITECASAFWEYLKDSALCCKTEESGLDSDLEMPLLHEDRSEEELEENFTI